MCIRDRASLVTAVLLYRCTVKLLPNKTIVSKQNKISLNDAATSNKNKYKYDEVFTIKSQHRSTLLYINMIQLLNSIIAFDPTVEPLPVLLPSWTNVHVESTQKYHTAINYTPHQITNQPVYYSGQLSLLSTAGWEMSSNLQATSWTPSLASLGSSSNRWPYGEL